MAGRFEQTDAFHNLGVLGQLHPAQPIYHIVFFDMETLHLTWDRNSALILFFVNKDLDIGVSKCLGISSMVQVQVAQGNVIEVRGMELELLEAFLDILLRCDIIMREPYQGDSVGPAY